MELDFGQPNSSIESPQNGNTIKLDFSNSDSPGFDFSGGSSTASFTAAMETSNLFPPPACTSFPAMREAIFLEAAMQPVEVDEESPRALPERRNVRLSTDPQSVAARRWRERISHKMRVLRLQRLVPGGTKMDTASMLDEACHFLKFLERQKHQLLQQEEGCAQVYQPEMPFSHTSN